MPVISKKYTYVAIVAILAGVYLYFQAQEKKFASILTFNDCVDAGFPVLETYPEQCKIPGRTFVNDHQLKATSTPPTQIEDDFLTHEYLLGGSPIRVYKSIDTLNGTSSFVYQGMSYIEYLNDDRLKDRVFIIERITEKVTEYYILLALGLYNGGTAPANAILLGHARPLSLTKEPSGRLQVRISCEGPNKCYKNFIVKDGILEQSN